MTLAHLYRVILVWTTAGIAWIVSLTEVETILKIAAASIAICYGIWRWIRDFKKKD